MGLQGFRSERDGDETPEERAVFGGEVFREAGERLAEAAEHNDGAGSGGAVHGVRETRGVLRRSAVENVGERKPVEGAGEAGFQERGGVGENEFDARGIDSGRSGRQLSEQEGAGVWVLGVGCKAKPRASLRRIAAPKRAGRKPRKSGA